MAAKASSAMMSELVLSLKSRKLAPLKPAPITSNAAMVDQTAVPAYRAGAH